MAFPTSVNDQITDSVTQSNVSVQGSVPATALGNLMIATAQALANAAHNATANQQQANILAQAATAAAVASLLNGRTSAEAISLLDAAQPVAAPAKNKPISV
jgi:hypothetical protein